MARPIRIEVKNGVYYISTKGNSDKSIARDDQDRQLFIETLQYVVKRYKWVCHAYCIGETEYNIVIETPKANLSIGMRQLNGMYTQKFNKRHSSKGHIFQGRFKAVILEKELYLKEICRYAVLLASRQSVAKNINTFKWSSYRATAGVVEPPAFLHTDWILSQFAKRPKIAQQKYKDYIKEGRKAENPLDSVKGQILLGSQEFIEQMTVSFLTKGRRKEDVPKWQRHIKRPPIEEVFKGIDSKSDKQRNKKIKEAHAKYGYTLKDIGKALGMHYTSISRIINS